MTPYYKTAPYWRKAEEHVSQEHEHYLNIRVDYPFWRTELRCKHCAFVVPAYVPNLIEEHLAKEHSIKTTKKVKKLGKRKKIKK